MRKALLMIALIGLVSMAINVAVAWGLCAWSEVGSIEEAGNIPTASAQCLTFYRSTGPGIEMLEWRASPDVPRVGSSVTSKTPPPKWSGVASLPGFEALNVPGHPRKGEWLEVAAGWPMRSMRWCMMKDDQVGARLKPVHLMVRLESPAHAGTPLRAADMRNLPLVPIWPGFIANTLASMAFLAIIFLALAPVYRFAYRRHFRLKRGLCPLCAYPIGTSPVCTECGCAVPRGQAAGANEMESGSR